MINPLLQDFNTEYQTAPFSKIKNEHFQPAFKTAIELAKKEIDEIVNYKAAPTFQNTLEALDFSGERLDRITSIFFNLNSAETNDEIQKIAQDISPLLSEFANDIRLNEKLFYRVKTVFQKKEGLKLNKEQEMLLEKNYKAFVRNGANLNDTDKLILREIDKNLSKLSLQFGENVLAETNAFELVITDKKELEGLPEGTREAAKILADQRDKKGWIITLDHPSYIPFMTYASNRNLREKMAKAFGARGFKNNKSDNQEIVLEIVKLRQQRANLLGYKSHAHFVLEERMAENPEKVKTFLNDLLLKAKPAANSDFEKIRRLAKRDGISSIQKWDGAFYSEKLKKRTL